MSIFSLKYIRMYMTNCVMLCTRGGMILYGGMSVYVHDELCNAMYARGYDIVWGGCLCMQI